MIAVISTAVVYAQDDITLCHPSSTEKFVLFAFNEDFNKEHQQPGNYVVIPVELYER